MIKNNNKIYKRRRAQPNEMQLECQWWSQQLAAAEAAVREVGLECRVLRASSRNILRIISAIGVVLWRLLCCWSQDSNRYKAILSASTCAGTCGLTELTHACKYRGRFPHTLKHDGSLQCVAEKLENCVCVCNTRHNIPELTKEVSSLCLGLHVNIQPVKLVD